MEKLTKRVYGLNIASNLLVPSLMTIQVTIGLVTVGLGLGGQYRRSHLRNPVSIFVIFSILTNAFLHFNYTRKRSISISCTRDV